MYQLLLGCNHLHHNGIFHRDIKPENILMKVNNFLRSGKLENKIEYFYVFEW